MSKHTHRKESYKLPPSAVSDPRMSQQHRRQQALEEQKRKRERRVDASRQLDLFADLSLGAGEDEPEDEDDDEQGPYVVRGGISQYAALLAPSQNSPPPSAPSPMPDNASTASSSKKKGAPKRRNKAKRKPSRWADKCMYAELLEMHDPEQQGMDTWAMQDGSDGLPDDLEHGWVALAPVPAGKRCLAICQQSAGVSGAVPNTILRSRVLGKAILAPFPSPLPSSTILDCILDENWKQNGIVHVLDVIRWKEQELGECEAAFRFWWRDTRLSEIHSLPPPIQTHAPMSPDSTTGEPSHPPQYKFAYPVTFTPVPFSTSTSYISLLTDIIPRARATRSVTVHIPSIPQLHLHLHAPGDAEEMQIDFSGPGHSAGVGQGALTQIDAHIRPDGLLLYVAEASYEAGTSPLCAWVPIAPYAEGVHAPGEDGAVPADERQVSIGEGPLALFERLVRKRLALRGDGDAAQAQVQMEM